MPESTGMTREQVRAWIAGFEAAAEQERAVWRLEGPRPAESIAAALALMDLYGRHAGPSPANDAVRERETESARSTWQRLRSRWRR